MGVGDRLGSDGERDEVVVRYLVQAAPAEVDAVASAIAVEQSIEMPPTAVRHAHIATETLGRVRCVVPAGPQRFVVDVGLAAATVADDPGQLLNMVFGNVALQPHVELVDLDLPEDLITRMGGPRSGIDGLRALVGAPRRALTCTALKPLGLAPADLASLASSFALAGIDIVKDDHGLADQRHAPFQDRLAACQEAVERANERTGSTCRYAPSLVGPPRTLHRQAEAARAAGVRVVLVAPMLVGLPVFHELVEEFGDLAFLAHPAFGGVQRIAPPLLLGKLFRLYGGDAVIFPNYGGRFSYTADTCAAIADQARSPWAEVAPTLPVPAGGMSVERVGEMLSFYGPDTMLLIGGALLAAGDELPARSREFVDAVHGHRYEVGVVA